MKLLFFTDTHIRGIAPKSRTDDFLNTLKNKFIEVSQIVNSEKIDYVLHGGDWFDRPDISPAIVREFAIILKQFNAPIYTISGNHDIYGYNPDTLTRTMLGLLEGAGVVSLIDIGKPIYLEKNGVKLQLYGNSYNYDIDGAGYRDYYVVKKDKNVDFCINMVHGMLLPKPFIENIKYTLIDNILQTEADITLVGHYHSGFGIKDFEGKYFVNPGSLIRIDASLKELERKPKVVIIELTDKINIKEVDLKTALKGEEVLSREHLEQAQLRRYQVNQFMQQIENAGEFKYSKIDLNNIIEEISNSEGVNDNVKLETIRRLEIAKKNVDKVVEE